MYLNNSFKLESLFWDDSYKWARKKIEQLDDYRTHFGDDVKDQVIAFLDDTITTANLSQNKQIIRNLEQTLKRFMLEKSYIESDLPIIETENLDGLNFDTLIKRVAEYREKINSFNSKLAKLQNYPNLS